MSLASVCVEAEGQVLIFMLFLALYIYLRSLTDSLKSRETTAAAAEAATKQGKRGLSSPSTLSNSRESLTVLHYFYYMVVMD